MNTPPNIIIIHSQARRWRDLVGCIQDALFDAQHDTAGLHGARPRLLVLISRNLLRLDDPGNVAALHRLCLQLQQQGVPHSFHCAVGDSPEPFAHMVEITLD